MIALALLGSLAAAPADAQADPKYVVCFGLQVDATAPAEGQEAVPTDAQLSLQILDGGCDALDPTLEVVLWADGPLEGGDDPEGSQEIQSWFLEEEELRAARGVLSLTPAEALLPDHRYRLSLAGISNQEIAFSTGDSEAEGMNEAPIWGALTASWSPCGAELRGRWSASPAPDPDGLSVLELRSGIEVIARALPTTDPHEFLTPAEAPDPFCAELVQVDARGVARSAGEKCATPEEDRCSVREACGCASAPASPTGAAGAAILPAAILFALRRRR